jgi:hypothetical protein
MARFRIFCEVSGGVTGYRCAYLKRKGIEEIYDDQLDAENDAAALSLKNNGPNARATFRYTVEDYHEHI